MGEELKEFYNKYPDLFIENFLGLKLSWYQKFLVRVICRK